MSAQPSAQMSKGDNKKCKDKCFQCKEKGHWKQDFPEFLAMKDKCNDYSSFILETCVLENVILFGLLILDLLTMFVILYSFLNHGRK